MVPSGLLLQLPASDRARLHEIETTRNTTKLIEWIDERPLDTRGIRRLLLGLWNSLAPIHTLPAERGFPRQPTHCPRVPYMAIRSAICSSALA